MLACATSDSTRTGWRVARPQGGWGRGAQLLAGVAEAVAVAVAEAAGGMVAGLEAAGARTRVGEASTEREWCMLASPFAEARREAGGVEAADEGREPPSEVGGEVVGVLLLLLPRRRNRREGQPGRSSEGRLEAWHRESGERPCCCSSKPQQEEAREPKDDSLRDIVSGRGSSHRSPGWGSYGTGSSPQLTVSCWVEAVGLELLREKACLKPDHASRALLGLHE